MFYFNSFFQKFFRKFLSELFQLHISPFKFEINCTLLFHIIPYYFLKPIAQKFYRNFYLHSHEIERNSPPSNNKNNLKQAKLFSLPKNQIKKKKKKPQRRRRRRRRRKKGHRARPPAFGEASRVCWDGKKPPWNSPQGKRVAGSQGWHVPPRQNGRAKPV